MKKTKLLSSAIAVISLLNTAIATDFYALTAAQTTLIPSQDKKITATKEKATCNPEIIGNSGGFSLCAFLSSERSGDTTSYAITSEHPVKAARFIQVVN